jgi:hypothetical protein
MDPSASLDDVEKWKVLFLPEFELDPFVVQSTSSLTVLIVLSWLPLHTTIAWKPYDQGNCYLWNINVNKESNGSLATD